MSGEIHAAGAAATAGLVASAIERKDPAQASEAMAGAVCLNCDSVLQGRFCHVCGQPAQISRTLVDLFKDALLALLQLDTRTWRTLPMLFTRPGTLTYRYIHGQRARYVSPLTLFLLSIFLFFFAFASTIEQDFAKFNGTGEASKPLTLAEAQRAVTDARKEKEKATRALATAETKAANLRAAGGDGAESDANDILDEARKDLKDAESGVTESEADLAKVTARDATQTAAAAPADAPKPAAPKPVDQTGLRGPNGEDLAGPPQNVVGVSFGDDVDLRATENERWQDRLRKEVESGKVKINFPNAAFNAKVREALMNADLGIYKLQQAASQFSFLLVPISLPFIALLFLWKRGVTLFDHAVFSLYSLSFVALLLVIDMVIRAVAGRGAEPYLGSAFLFGLPAHLYFQFKGAYRLRWWSALWRTLMFLFFAIFTLIIFCLVILLLGLAS